ncbi:hypothetical protein ACS5NO_32085 [Larkinella sp. GY13]|uniref:hypothetical protein n=1 Tax=Larkinella sp. GY13 TaxID=3453720 RepID=UPI003EEA0F6B
MIVTLMVKELLNATLFQVKVFLQNGRIIIENRRKFGSRTEKARSTARRCARSGAVDVMPASFFQATTKEYSERIEMSTILAEDPQLQRPPTG